MLGPRDREIIMRMVALEERSYVLGDQLAVHMRAAAAAAARGMSDDQLVIQFGDQFAAYESEFLRLNQEQVALFGELTEAGRAL